MRPVPVVNIFLSIFLVMLVVAVLFIKTAVKIIMTTLKLPIAPHSKIVCCVFIFDNMDATEIKSLKSRLAKLEGRDSTAKAELVSKVVPVVGTFDHSAMDAADVAKYTCEKLGLKVEAGSETAAITGYLAAAKPTAAVAYAMDSKAPKAGGKLASTLQARA